LNEKTEKNDDRVTPERVRDCFRGMAGGKVRSTCPPLFLLRFLHSRIIISKINQSDVSSLQPYITELDLQRVSLPSAAIDFLTKHMDGYDAERDTVVHDDADNGVVDGRFDYTAFFDGLFE
jgi:hypothetical protein